MKSLFLVVFLIFIVSCSGQGTNTGNPDVYAGVPTTGTSSPVDSMISTLCSRVNTCFPSASISTCSAQIIVAGGFTDEISFNPPYSTLTDLKSAYTAGSITMNETALSSCLGSISQLACTNSLMTSAYAASQPINFSKLYLLFRTSTQCLVIKQ